MSDTPEPLRFDDATQLTDPPQPAPTPAPRLPTRAELGAKLYAHPDWPRAKRLVDDGDLMALLLDFFALYHPPAIAAAVERMQIAD